ncbi:LLM class flavin-dependent oxidoreductase [Rhodoplanes sp. SY1]|uniref:LLM class flavin-dependent oxidoreductase n=1 Tax=Rhodoplanes sp. SY1 TaxID=3166646 RepID=UPI0038B64AD0
MRIGVNFDGFVPTGEAIALAKDSVAAGAGSLWVAEHLGYREAIATCMAFAFAVPGEAALVPTAVSPYVSHAVPTAMALATLDEVASGRAAIAVGTGNPMFLKEAGQAMVKPVAAVREFVAALRALWTGEPVHTEGEFVRLAGARLAVVPKTPIPVYVAAIGPDMLRLAGRVGDGVVLSAGLSIASVRQSIAHCTEAAAGAGRDPDAIRRAGYIFFAASPDGRAARDIVRERLAFVMRNKFLAENIKSSGIPIDHEAVIAAIARRDIAGAAALVSDEAVDAFGIAGTPDHCMQRLADFVAAGLDEPVLGLLGTADDCALGLDVIRRFAAETR